MMSATNSSMDTCRLGVLEEDDLLSRDRRHEDTQLRHFGQALVSQQSTTDEWVPLEKHVAALQQGGKLLQVQRLSIPADFHDGETARRH